MEKKILVVYAIIVIVSIIWLIKTKIIDKGRYSSLDAIITVIIGVVDTAATLSVLILLITHLYMLSSLHHTAKIIEDEIQRRSLNATEMNLESLECNDSCDDARKQTQ